MSFVQESYAGPIERGMRFVLRGDWHPDGVELIVTRITEKCQGDRLIWATTDEFSWGRDTYLTEDRFRTSARPSPSAVVHEAEPRGVTLRLRDVIKATGLPPTTIYRWMKLGRFPRPVRVGTKNVGWLETEVKEYSRLLPACSGEGDPACCP